MRVTGELRGIAPDGWMLSLLSETTARIFFVLDGEENIADYAFTLIKDGNEAEITPHADGERYRIDIADIGAYELSDEYTVRVSRGGESLEVSFTALAYSASVLRGECDNAALVNLARALKLYSDAANTFVSKNS